MGTAGLDAPVIFQPTAKVSKRNSNHCSPSVGSSKSVRRQCPIGHHAVCRRATHAELALDLSRPQQTILGISGTVVLTTLSAGRARAIQIHRAALALFRSSGVSLSDIHPRGMNWRTTDGPPKIRLVCYCSHDLMPFSASSRLLMNPKIGALFRAADRKPGCDEECCPRSSKTNTSVSRVLIDVQCCLDAY